MVKKLAHSYVQRMILLPRCWISWLLVIGSNWTELTTKLDSWLSEKCSSIEGLRSYVSPCRRNICSRFFFFLVVVTFIYYVDEIVVCYLSERMEKEELRSSSLPLRVNFHSFYQSRNSNTRHHHTPKQHTRALELPSDEHTLTPNNHTNSLLARRPKKFSAFLCLRKRTQTNRQ